MKIVHSFWSKPMTSSKLHCSEKIQFSLMSFAFSCLQAKKFYDNVELVTDGYGKRLLVDHLRLPYTKCITVLDDINDYETDLFALGKAFAYGLQTEPFIHIDGDLFIWDRFEKSTEKSPLTALHLETYPLYSGGYAEVLGEIRRKFNYIPDCLKEVSNPFQITAANAGIIGGTDIAFFKKFSEEIFRFVDSNPERTSLNAPWMFNVIFEQLMFVYFNSGHREINYYLNETPKLYSFWGVPNSTKIVHARTDERSYASQWALANLMKNDYPQYYERVKKLTEVLCRKMRDNGEGDFHKGKILNSVEKKQENYNSNIFSIFRFTLNHLEHTGLIQEGLPDLSFFGSIDEFLSWIFQLLGDKLEPDAKKAIAISRLEFYAYCQKPKSDWYNTFVIHQFDDNVFFDMDFIRSGPIVSSIDFYQGQNKLEDSSIKFELMPSILIDFFQGGVVAIALGEGDNKLVLIDFYQALVLSQFQKPCQANKILMKLSTWLTLLSLAEKQAILNSFVDDAFFDSFILEKLKIAMKDCVIMGALTPISN